MLYRESDQLCFLTQKRKPLIVHKWLLKPFKKKKELNNLLDHDLLPCREHSTLNTGNKRCESSVTVEASGKGQALICLLIHGMCPHTTVYVSSYYSICVLILGYTGCQGRWRRCRRRRTLWHGSPAILTTLPHGSPRSATSWCVCVCVCLCVGGWVVGWGGGGGCSSSSSSRRV
jgi:hypothetical protein